MDKSKVYYTNMRTGFNNNLLDKLKKLSGKQVSKQLILTANILLSKSISASREIWHFSVPITQRL